MKRDTRLSGVLHMLLHMAEAGRPVTSEALAGAMQTNAVVVRRVMAGLREAGVVRSGKGHGGGWSMARDLAAVTLGDVHAALGAPAPFALGHRNAAPTCLVEQAVNAALGDALRDAEALLLARMGAVTLAELAADFRRRMAAAGQPPGMLGHGLGHQAAPAAGAAPARAGARAATKAAASAASSGRANR